MNRVRFWMPLAVTTMLSIVLQGCGKTESISRIPESRVSLQLNIDYHRLTEPLTGRSFTSVNGLTANTFLGFGGVLVYYGLALDGGFHHHAYDLACPVEVDRTVRVSIFESVKARCAKCGSTFDIQYGGGVPIGGVAQREGYFLRSYRTNLNGRELLITR